MANSKQILRRQARVEKWQSAHPHIVDQLIRERAHRLSQSRFWPLYRFFLNRLLGYKRAVAMADEIAKRSGYDGFEYVSQELQLKLNVTGLEHIPKEGLFILAVNHPTGLADGIAVFDALKKTRPDLIFFANSDALRVSEGFKDIIIPVEWVEAKRSRARTKETLIAMTQAIKEERALLLFPSGRLAYIDEQKNIVEHEWQPTVAVLPRKYKCKIIPAHLSGRNSWLYYWFRSLNEELRDITLFHELLNKHGKSFDLQIGPPIDYQDLPDNTEQSAAYLQEFVSKKMPAGVDWQSFKADKKF